MLNDSPELPEWIQTLLIAERDKAYSKGYKEGYEFGIESARKAVNSVERRW